MLLTREYSRLVAMPPNAQRIALLDQDEHRPVNVWDWKRKTVVRSVPRWTGQHTADGRLGLYAPSRGGLELIDIKTGEVMHTLIPRVAEGVFNIKTMFTSNNRHVVYYHSGRRSIRVFRVSDGVKVSMLRSVTLITASAMFIDYLLFTFYEKICRV
jgi:NACHT domain- and WD repeat-containing protein